jgi:hypothetical protein
MKTFNLLAILICVTLGLSACSTPYKEREAPCPPTASLSKNPCNAIPINFAMVNERKKHS